MVREDDLNLGTLEYPFDAIITKPHRLPMAQLKALPYFVGEMRSTSKVVESIKSPDTKHLLLSNKGIVVSILNDAEKRSGANISEREIEVDKAHDLPWYCPRSR